MSEPVVRVGVGVFVFKDGKFLMGKRKGSHGSGTWSIPGGHMEFGETLEQTAIREVKEETDLDIKNVRFGAITNDLFPDDNKHYITIWVTSEYKDGEGKITEPDKFIEQKWATFEQLPKALFKPWQNLLSSDFIESIKQEAKKTL